MLAAVLSGVGRGGGVAVANAVVVVVAVGVAAAGTAVCVGIGRGVWVGVGAATTVNRLVPHVASLIAPLIPVTLVHALQMPNRAAWRGHLKVREDF